jgi:hypothetical protein
MRYLLLALLYEQVPAISMAILRHGYPETMLCAAGPIAGFENLDT